MTPVGLWMAVAAQCLGHRGVGVDLSEDYLQQAVKRLTALTLPLYAPLQLPEIRETPG